jgi:hypothetical protein
MNSTIAVVMTSVNRERVATRTTGMSRIAVLALEESQTSPSNDRASGEPFLHIMNCC